MITDDGRRRLQWRPRPERVIIMEPNISFFQKSSLVPIMAMERWFRKNPDWDGELHITLCFKMLVIFGRGGLEFLTRDRHSRYRL
jgi:hypothetical protein